MIDFSNTITVNDLLDLCEKEHLSMNTPISIDNGDYMKMVFTAKATTLADDETKIIHLQ